MGNVPYFRSASGHRINNRQAERRRGGYCRTLVVVFDQHAVHGGPTDAEGGCEGRGRLVTALALLNVEPMTGIEPAYSAWEADVLPLNYIGDVDWEG